MQIELSEIDLFHMLMCTLQYAIGRQSYITGVVVDLIIDHFQELSSIHQETLYNRLNDEINSYHRRGEFVGMEIDDEGWQKLRRVLEGELNVKSSD